MNIFKKSKKHSPFTCTNCNYDLAGIDLAGNCPECGNPILQNCFWCDYDLTNTAPDSICPECGVPATTSIGLGVLASAPDQLLKSIHNGFRLVTVLILVYIVWVVASAIAFMAILINLDDSTIYLATILGSIVSNVLILAILYGWWKLAAPIPNLPESIDGSDRRNFLNATLIAFAILTAITLLLSFIPSNLDPYDETMETIDWINMAIGVVGVIMMIILYIAQLRYIQWFAKVAKNQKMHKRAKHMIWSGPLIFIVGAPFLLLGPLVVLVLYWNMLEYLRRDVKAIRKYNRAIA